MEKVKRTPASLKNMVETFGMEILHKGRDFDNTVVTISDVNRPALQLVGFYDYFDDKRLQILGRGEMQFLERMTEAERTRGFNKLLSYPFPAMIVARDMEAPPELVQMANRQQKFIQGLEAALVRIENKTYGIDRMTGELIPKERLRIVPHATLSVASKNARKK